MTDIEIIERKQEGATPPSYKKRVIRLITIFFNMPPRVPFLKFSSILTTVGLIFFGLLQILDSEGMEWAAFFFLLPAGVIMMGLLDFFGLGNLELWNNLTIPFIYIGFLILISSMLYFVLIFILILPLKLLYSLYYYKIYKRSYEKQNNTTNNN